MVVDALHALSSLGYDTAGDLTNKVATAAGCSISNAKMETFAKRVSIAAAKMATLENPDSVNEETSTIDDEDDACDESTRTALGKCGLKWSTVARVLGSFLS